MRGTPSGGISSGEARPVRLPTPTASRAGLIGDGLLAAALAVVLFPVTVSAVWDSSWGRTFEVAVVVVVALGHVAVAARRLAPRASLAVGGLMVLVLLFAPLIDAGPDTQPFSAVLVPSVLVFPVLLYTVAAWCSPTASYLALGASCLGAIVVLLRLWAASYLTVAQPGLASTAHPVRSWQLFLLLAVVAMIPAPWLLGSYRRLRVLYVAELEDRARLEAAERTASSRRAVEHERQRIAREMHDVVAHSLAVMVNQAEGGRTVSAKDPARAAKALGTIAGIGRDAMRDMRGILAVMREEGPEPTSPQPTLAALPELVAGVGRSGLPITMTEEGVRSPMSPTAELAAYRFVQEALTNVLKHAGDTSLVEVSLSWRPDALDLTVRNQAARPPAPADGRGLGLSGMSTRMSALGGSLAVTCTDHEFRVDATIPTTAEEGPTA